jgi:OmpA-OmpF porin, OOP family
MTNALANTGRVNLYGIQFDFDKVAVRPDSKRTLDEIANLLKQAPDLRLEIVGHTDNKGTPDYNLDLSGRRAGRVVEALTATYGIAADRLSARGAGMSAPVAGNETEAGRTKNRRVELIAKS